MHLICLDEVHILQTESLLIFWQKDAFLSITFASWFIFAKQLHFTSIILGCMVKSAGLPKLGIQTVDFRLPHFFKIFITFYGTNKSFLLQLSYAIEQ